MKNLVDSVIVSISFATDKDKDVLVVGRKRKNQSVEIINAIQGPEARELYNRLTTVKESKGE